MRFQRRQQGREGNRRIHRHHLAAPGLLAGFAGDFLPALLLLRTVLGAELHDAAAHGDRDDPRRAQFHRLLHNQLHLFRFWQALIKRDAQFRLGGGQFACQPRRHALRRHLRDFGGKAPTVQEQLCRVARLHPQHAGRMTRVLLRQRDKAADFTQPVSIKAVHYFFLRDSMATHSPLRFVSRIV